jgi:hypothetical protein
MDRVTLPGDSWPPAGPLVLGPGPRHCTPCQGLDSLGSGVDRMSAPNSRTQPASSSSCSFLNSFHLLHEDHVAEMGVGLSECSSHAGRLADTLRAVMSCMGLPQHQVHGYLGNRDHDGTLKSSASS